MRTRRHVLGGVVVWGILTYAAAVSAEPGSDGDAGDAGQVASEQETPWSKGVTTEQRARAQELLAKGNEAFLKGEYDTARDRYEEAVAQWDHPAIRFNLARTYTNLQQPVEAYENLELSLKYGAEPLDATVFTEANTLEAALKGRLKEVSIECTQKGVQVSLDGAEYLSCPGKKTQRITLGRHQIVGESKDEVTGENRLLTKSIEIIAEENRALEPVIIELADLASSTITKRRWAVWKPWTVVGSGLAVAAIGGIFEWQAYSKRDDANAALKTHCEAVACYANGTSTRADDGSVLAQPEPDAALRGYLDDEDRALLYSKIGVGMMVTGGTVAVAGAVLVYMNRAQTIFIDEAEQAPPGSTITPTVGPGQVGLLVDMPF